LSQATAAYTIASGPSPVVNAVDIVVLATLSRMVIDDAWSGERFGDRAALLRSAYHRLEPISLELARSVFSAEQIEELQRIILEWRTRNPHATAISSVHFRDVATSIGTPTSGGIDSFGGLFSLLGLDPFSSLDPAVREIAQSRELAERSLPNIFLATTVYDGEAALTGQNLTVYFFASRQAENAFLKLVICDAVALAAAWLCCDCCWDCCAFA
jgi:hypothetical protein